MTLTDVYCRVNRARGMEVGLEDLEQQVLANTVDYMQNLN